MVAKNSIEGIEGIEGVKGMSEKCELAVVVRSIYATSVRVYLPVAFENETTSIGQLCLPVNLLY